MHNLDIGIINIAIVALVSALLITVYSIIRFSSILIKLVALEVLTNLLMAGTSVWALINKQPVFIDVCITLALIMFLAIVAYYQFLIKKEKDGANINW